MTKLFLFFAGVVLLNSFSVYSQLSEIYGDFDVRVNVGGKDFQLRFEPDKVTTSAVAGKLCREQAEAIGVTQETLSECEGAVGSYLQSSVNKWIAEKTLQVPVTIGGTEFDVRFLPESESASSMARKLCIQQAEKIGVTEETLPACLNPVTDYLQTAANRWMAEKILDFPITVSGKRFDLRFLPERETATGMATRLCTEQAAEIGLQADGLADCVQSIAAVVQDQIDRWTADKTLSLPVTIDDKTFTIQFMPERETPGAMARKLCVEQAEVLGITEETFVKGCYEPVTAYIQRGVDAWLQDKTLSTVLKLNDVDFTVSFFPERPNSVPNVARKLCVDNAEALKLTQETIVNDCISPVRDYLQNAVTKWATDKTVVVPITIDEQTYNIQFMPERQSAVSMARKLCVEQASAFGLTEENIVSNCISPVNDVLQNAVKEWVAKKTNA